MKNDKKPLALVLAISASLCSCASPPARLPFYDPDRSAENVDVTIRNGSPLSSVLVRTFTDGDQCMVDAMQSIFRGGRPEGAVPPGVYRETRASVGKTFSLWFFSINGCQGISSFTPKAGYAYSVNVVAYSQCLMEVRREIRSSNGRVLEAVREDSLSVRDVQFAPLHGGSMCVPERAGSAVSQHP